MTRDAGLGLAHDIPAAHEPEMGGVVHLDRTAMTVASARPSNAGTDGPHPSPASGDQELHSTASGLDLEEAR